MSDNSAVLEAVIEWRKAGAVTAEIRWAWFGSGNDDLLRELDNAEQAEGRALRKLAALGDSLL